MVHAYTCITAQTQLTKNKESNDALWWIIYL